MKCTCPGLAIDKMRYQEVKDRCTVRWSVVVQCRYWATLHVLEYLIGARYMKCTCPGLIKSFPFCLLNYVIFNVLSQ